MLIICKLLNEKMRLTVGVHEKVFLCQEDIHEQTTISSIQNEKEGL